MRRKLLTADGEIKVSAISELLSLTGTLHSLLKQVAKEAGILQKNQEKEVPELASLIVDYAKMAFGVDFLRPSRKKEVAIARHAACYLLKKHIDLTLTQIAVITGNSNHATVYNSLKRAEELKARSVLFKAKVENIEREILKKCLAAA